MLMERRRRVRLFDYVLQPLLYADGYDQTKLREDMERSGFPVCVFQGLKAQRRRDTWALELPLGLFAGDITPGAVTWERELEARKKLMDAIKTSSGSRGFTSRDIVLCEQRWLYREPALNAFQFHGYYRAMFGAAYRFLLAAKKDPGLILGHDKRRVVPLTDRPLVDGKRARGPSWSPEEDRYLRQFFKPRNCGRPECPHCWDSKRDAPNNKERHHHMEPGWWSILLDNKLNGIRTEASVRLRLVVLNNELKRELMPDGFLPRSLRSAFVSRFLGESLRIPKKPPRGETRRQQAKRLAREMADRPLGERLIADRPSSAHSRPHSGS